MYEIVASADANFTDEVYRTADLDPVSLQDSVWKFNAVASFGPIEGTWDVSLIGKNLTDEATLSYSSDTPLFPGAQQGRIDAPRSFTLRARYRF